MPVPVESKEKIVLEKRVLMKGVFWILLLASLLSYKLTSAQTPSDGLGIFSPPSEETIPSGPFGDLVRKGEKSSRIPKNMPATMLVMT